MLERLKAIPGRGRCDLRRADSARRRQFAGALRPARRGDRSGEVPAGDRALRAARATLRSPRRRSSPAARSPRQTTTRQPSVIIIDDLMAAQLFPNGNAVGQRMLARVTTPEPDTFEVIGVVKHQRHTTMMNDGEEGMFFTDGYSQFGAAFRWAVRTSGDPEAITGAVRSAMVAAGSAAADDRAAHLAVVPRRAHRADAVRVDPDRRLRGGRRDPRDDRTLRRARHHVRQRTTEIGVRMAFGATQRQHPLADHRARPAAERRRDRCLA